jgi:hypothetical protein
MTTTDQPIEAITADRDRLADTLHIRRAHPDYEYDTTEGQRKAWDCHPPEGDGWEPNITSENPEAWERFDYTEEAYWRRLKPPTPEPAAIDPATLHPVVAGLMEALGISLDEATRAFATAYGEPWLRDVATAIEATAAAASTTGAAA